MTSSIDLTAADPHCEILDGLPPLDATQALLDRAWETGHRQTRLAVARIRRDLAALPQWIAIAEQEAAARQKVKDAEAELRALRACTPGTDRPAGNPGAAEPVVAKPLPARKRSASVMKIRQWLRANGHDVPQRGVLGSRFIEIYEDAHGRAAG